MLNSPTEIDILEDSFIIFLFLGKEVFSEEKLEAIKKENQIKLFINAMNLKKINICFYLHHDYIEVTFYLVPNHVCQNYY